jgi:hypothetical protein
MNHTRQPIYATNATFSSVVVDSDAPVNKGVIRPPIRAAYDSETAYIEAVNIGIAYAAKHDIEYVDHY